MGIRLERLFGKFLGIGFSEVGNKTGLKDRKKLLSEAKESIKIVSTNLPSLDSLNEALNRGVAVEIITVEGHSSYNLKQLSKRGILLFELKKPPPRQFDVVDGKHVRLEEPDAPWLPSQEQYVINNYSQSFGLLNKFASLKEKAIAL